MRIVIQNPHLTSDTWTSGIHDYVVEFLRRHRPAVQITPPRRLVKWFLWLRRKGLPLTGWRYVVSGSGLRDFDAWLCFGGSVLVPYADLPRGFSGLKLYHVMDHSFCAGVAHERLRAAGVDYVLGYASHDRWCEFFRHSFPGFDGRVIPWPFGFSARFRCETPFGERERKCCAMGAVNPVRDPTCDPDLIREYAAFFSGREWSHEMRARIRDRQDGWGDFLTSYFARPPLTKNLAYDSPSELNRHQLFVNDDSITHYPPARTYEGAACGCVMVCSDHPCYEEFGFRGGENCVVHRWGDAESFAEKTRAALRDQEGLLAVHGRSLAHARQFSHPAIAERIPALVRLLLDGKVDEAKALWR